MKESGGEKGEEQGDADEDEEDERTPFEAAAQYAAPAPSLIGFGLFGRSVLSTMTSVSTRLAPLASAAAAAAASAAEAAAAVAAPAVAGGRASPSIARADAADDATLDERSHVPNDEEGGGGADAPSQRSPGSAAADAAAAARALPPSVADFAQKASRFGSSLFAALDSAAAAVVRAADEEIERERAEAVAARAAGGAEGWGAEAGADAEGWGDAAEGWGVDDDLDVPVTLTRASESAAAEISSQPAPPSAEVEASAAEGLPEASAATPPRDTTETPHEAARSFGADVSPDLEPLAPSPRAAAPPPRAPTPPPPAPPAADESAARDGPAADLPIVASATAVDGWMAALDEGDLACDVELSDASVPGAPAAPAAPAADALVEPAAAPLEEPATDSSSLLAPSSADERIAAFSAAVRAAADAALAALSDPSGGSGVSGLAATPASAAHAFRSRGTSAASSASAGSLIDDLLGPLPFASPTAPLSVAPPPPPPPGGAARAPRFSPSAAFDAPLFAADFAREMVFAPLSSPSIDIAPFLSSHVRLDEAGERAAGGAPPLRGVARAAPPPVLDSAPQWTRSAIFAPSLRGVGVSLDDLVLPEPAASAAAPAHVAAAAAPPPPPPATRADGAAPSPPRGSLASSSAAFDAAFGSESGALLSASFAATLAGTVSLAAAAAAGGAAAAVGGAPPSAAAPDAALSPALAALDLVPLPDLGDDDDWALPARR
jgi:hypothetical protein